MASFADISIRLNADLKGFSTQMQNAQRELGRISKQLNGIGKNLSIGLTAPIVALGVSSVRAFDAQAKSIAQVESALASTGGVANKTLSELQALASDMQNNSLFGDEAILQDVTAQLLTFTNIANEQFDRTQQAALDLSTRLGGDLKGASIQLGKALNDPIKGLSALGRSGIQFTDSQRKVIKSLAESGRLAEAQNIILGELETQYGGAAAAAAKAGTGPLKQLSNILGDITEDFGKIIIEAIAPFVAKLKEMAIAFQNLSPQTKEFIVIGAAIAAAIGPIVLGISTLLPLLPAIGAGFAALTGPVGLAVAAIAGVAVVIVKYWEPIKKQLVEVANYFIDIYNESLLVRAGVQLVITQFQNLFSIGKFLFNGLVDLVINFGKNFVTVFTTAGELFKAVVTGNFSEIPAIIGNASKKVFNGFQDLFTDLGKEFEVLKKDLSTNITEGIDNALNGKIEKITIPVEVVRTSTADTSDATAPASGGSVSPVVVNPKAVADISKKITASVPEIMQEIPLAFTNDRFSSSAVQIINTTKQVSQSLNDFSQQSTAAIQSAAQNFAVGFGEIIGSLATGQAGMNDVFALLLNTIAEVVTQLGAAAIGIGTSMLAIKSAFSNPATAIAAGVALTAVGSVIKSVIPAILSGGGGGETAFASGGIVYGPTRALVGEYAGARNNPEVIAPLNKLRDMIEPVGSSMQPVIIGGTTRVKGADLEIALQRTNRVNNRRK